MVKKKHVDLSTLSLGTFIAHDIPRRLKSDEASDIPLSESVPKLEKSIINFFCNRLQGTLEARGQLVDVDPRLQDRFLPKAIDDWFKKPNLVAFSQSAAKHLYIVQGGSASPGMLGVSAAKIDGKTAISLMKLPEEAARAPGERDARSRTAHRPRCGAGPRAKMARSDRETAQWIARDWTRRRSCGAAGCGRAISTSPPGR